MPGPYHGKRVQQWPKVTARLLRKHPLNPLGSTGLVDAAVAAWSSLWSTNIGVGAAAVPLSGLQMPATVVGYFFEILLARELQSRWPEQWRPGLSKAEKDLVFIPDPHFSIEVKTSGQLGDRIYGNRSFGQAPANQALVRKDKSGYYLTANFFGSTLTLLRFGWIDGEDWRPQTSPTGQMAGLADEVYSGKLVRLPGPYRLLAPAALLQGVGPKLMAQLDALGIRTVGDFLAHLAKLPPRLQAIAAINRDQLAECAAPSE
jgi:hypothetical protein